MLNEPLRAEIALISASPDEINDLTVALASVETFARYGIDRPFYLQGIEFNVVNGGAGGSVVQIRSRSPITEPFLTFLVEATWSSGRLLREYTVLLDPPTYAAPTSRQAPVVEAPRQSTPSDGGRIERQASPAPEPQQARTTPRPAQAARSSDAGDMGTEYESSPPPEPQPQADDAPYDAPYSATNGSDVQVERGDTLWGLASRWRPDSRLTMNQTMLAIFEANRDAFGGNINVLRAGARLRIPSADDAFRIDRNSALSEVQRQHSAWAGGSPYVAPEPTTRTSLTLVPPDDEVATGDYEDDSETYEPLTREQEIENRIAELEAADVPNQQSLIEIRDNELASLRQELANIRGEVYEPPVTDTTDDTFVDEVVGDDAAIDEVVTDDSEDTSAADDETGTAADTVVPTNIVTSAATRDKGFVDKAIDFLAAWGIIIGALLLVAGGLFWFVKRGGRDADDGDDGDRPWDALDSDEIAMGAISATSTMQAPSPEEAFVVVEQDSGVHPILEDTVEAPASDFGEPSGSFGSLEDTFSSETAVNLDQTDPIAEADFHMAYGLYDQAADLINGALEADPRDKSLMSKLCEIYFVWGNRDAFVDAASRLKSAIGSAGSPDWDKIVIMGQQIAADHAMFAGAGVAGATRAVDLSFDEAGDDAGALDMDFGADASGESEVIDLGAGDDSDDGVDFNFAESDDSSSIDFDVTAETPTLESSMTEATAEMPSPTLSTPTIEEQFAGFGEGTSELPSLDESLYKAISDNGQDADATAEINLDDLDLDITGQNEELSDDTGINEALADDFGDVTGRNLRIDPDATGQLEGLDLSDLESTGMRLAPDETGQNPMLSAEEEQDSGDFESLLDATGHTQVLSGDMAVDTATDFLDDLDDNDATMLAPDSGDEKTLRAYPSDAETMLAPMDDEDNFDFAKTEALPPEAFTANYDLDSTAETPAIARTDVDLDLDDLTAALQVSEIGDTVEQRRDDATVEQPRPRMRDKTAEVPTMSLGPDDMSSDLHEARTMTEVGTKLDLA
ncbi:MAG: hypothetical protein OEY74_05805, partial [Gammaproteobacteria bacterium]|nr:hypothetical protein [Gammaproteobacteria bacterium]